MAAARDIIAEWGARFLANDALARSLGASVKIRVTGRGGGVWVLNCRGGARFTEEDGDADCSLTLSAEDLAAIDAGTLNPQAAYVEHRLQVQGDLGVALTFSSLLFG